jgi:hypothetical protein
MYVPNRQRRTWFQEDNLLLAELVDADRALAAIGMHQHTTRLIRISHQRRGVVAHFGSFAFR